MDALNHKIDFLAIISVNRANPNGDPLYGNRPRTDYNDFGEISDVCIKRKIRNRMQDLKNPIFVQQENNRTDECKSLSERANKVLGDINDRDLYAKKACETWLDVRSFGQVFAFQKQKGKDSKGTKHGKGEQGADKERKENGSGISVGVRGPVSIHQAVSVSPVNVRTFQITKSVNGEPADKEKSDVEEGEDKLSSDRMGQKHFVQFGLYVLKGSINVQLADKTGFSREDADVIKECLRTLFVNDASSARPEGSMEVVKLFWWQHNCKDGQYSSAKVHRSVHVMPKDVNGIPASVDDYEIKVDELPGLTPEIIDGL